MKRFGLLVCTLVFLASCSSTLEERARKQMRVTLANEFKYADDFDISKEEVIYNNDSVFIMTFYMKGKKDNGEAAEGKMEYAYEEVSMWAYGHPEVRVWNDYFRDLKPFSKNSVEEHLELMRSMAEKGYAMPNMTPFGIMWSASFSVGRKVPSEFSIKVDEYKKEKEESNK